MIINVPFPTIVDILTRYALRATRYMTHFRFLQKKGRLDFIYIIYIIYIIKIIYIFPVPHQPEETSNSTHEARSA